MAVEVTATVQFCAFPLTSIPSGNEPAVHFVGTDVNAVAVPALPVVVVAVVAVVALPLSVPENCVAVMVAALKLPEASRFTNVEAVLLFVAYSREDVDNTRLEIAVVIVDSLTIRVPISELRAVVFVLSATIRKRISEFNALVVVDSATIRNPISEFKAEVAVLSVTILVPISELSEDVIVDSATVLYPISLLRADVVVD